MFCETSESCGSDLVVTSSRWIMARSRARPSNLLRPNENEAAFTVLGSRSVVIPYIRDPNRFPVTLSTFSLITGAFHDCCSVVHCASRPQEVDQASYGRAMFCERQRKEIVFYSDDRYHGKKQILSTVSTGSLP